MQISIEKKKEEAIARLKLMGIYPTVITEFEEGKLNRSEPPIGGLYWIEGEELEKIKSFEEEYNALVYLVIRSYTEIGTMDSYLYVSDYEEEWDIDRGELEEGFPVVYVNNLDYPDCSEFGEIEIAQTIGAGFIRIS